MIKDIRIITKASLLLLTGSFFLWSCESDVDGLGAQFFEGNAANAVTIDRDILAYNIGNNDSLRTDGSQLSQAILGVFKESTFGMQKANYVSQARLSFYAPDFGENPVVDSVVMELKPLPIMDSVATSTDEDYIFSEGNVEAKKVVNTYPVARYGKANKPITIQVHRVEDFLGSASAKIYSNKSVGYSTLLGVQTFNGKVSAITITKDSDNTELLKREATIRIPLDKVFFQDYIINKAKQPELSDASNFIRYFKGIRISTQENDGFLFSFLPTDTKIKIYYKRKKTSTDGSAPNEVADVFSLDFGVNNARFTQILYDRLGTPSFNFVSSGNFNTISGDTKLYAQGMGGPSVGLKIPDALVSELRQKYKNDKIALVSAKIRLYVDEEWTNSYQLPLDFTTLFFDREKAKADTSIFLKDMSLYSNHNNVFFGKDADGNGYYDLVVTQTLKDIIEEKENNKDLIFSVGSFVRNPNNGMPINPDITTRVFVPNRVVFVGATGMTNNKRVQLNLTYTSK